MDESRAVLALQALAQETRLAVFRLLVAAGPSGVPAGAIAERLQVPPSTLSFHLKELDRAGLVRSWRRARQIFYTAEFETMRRLLAFLTEDCCGGHPEICGGLVPLLEEVGRRATSCRSEAKPAGRCRG
jgi:DNA-binding transcriptional ArsR family regulator